MNLVRKFIFAISLVLAFSLTGAAETQSWYQGSKPPEKVKEKEKDKQPPPSDKDKERGGNRDDKKGGDKKKPDSW